MPGKNILAASLLAIGMGLAPAVLAAPSIHVLATFDFPTASGSTYALGINTRGDTVGYFDDSGGLEEGFVRYRTGKFSAPIIADPGASTIADAINSSGTVAGFDEPGAAGFVFSAGAFSYFRAPLTYCGAEVDTYITGLNDLGSFVGYHFCPTDPDAGNQPFTDISNQYLELSLGTLISYNAYAMGINDGNEIVGLYVDDDANLNGFVVAADGNVTTLDYPGAVNTFLFGINNQETIVGGYNETAGIVTPAHGMVSQRGNFLSFDYPGAISTAINGVNDSGEVAGYYTDSSNLTHGFIGRITYRHSRRTHPRRD